LLNRRVYGNIGTEKAKIPKYKKNEVRYRVNGSARIIFLRVWRPELLSIPHEHKKKH